MSFNSNRLPMRRAGRAGTDLRMLAMNQKMRADLRFGSREGGVFTMLKVFQTQLSHSSTYRTALRLVNLW